MTSSTSKILEEHYITDHQKRSLYSCFEGTVINNSIAKPFLSFNLISVYQKWLIQWLSLKENHAVSQKVCGFLQGTIAPFYILCNTMCKSFSRQIFTLLITQFLLEILNLAIHNIKPCVFTDQQNHIFWETLPWVINEAIRNAQL